MQAQGFYQGKTSIWVPKQRQVQMKQPQPQAPISITKGPVKPTQNSACAITNLESKTIRKLPQPTSQPKILSTRVVLKQAQLLLQLMQGKVSQTVVVELFKAISQTTHKETYEKKLALKSKIKDPVLFFSSQATNNQWITKLPN